MYKLESLDNGLKIATEPMPHMESVAIGIWIRAGGRYEDAGNSGISHLLEHLLFKGTETRDMMKIKQEIEGRGGSFNGFTAEEHTCYLVKVQAKDAGLGVDILSDMVLRPKLDESEIRKEKSVIIEEINMYKDIPSHYVHEVLAEMMWPEQPLGMPLAGTVESVRAIGRDSIVNYRAKHYNPSNMLLAAAGRIKEGELADFGRKYLSAAAKSPTTKFEAATCDQARPAIKLLTKETEQTHIAIGLHATDRFHPDRYGLTLLNILMGANMSSRLFHIIRDEMALCYEISSAVRRYDDCGAFVVSAGVDHTKLTKSLEAIMKELSRVKKEAVHKGELERAKEYYRGQLLFALEDTMSHMLWLGEKVISGEKDFSMKTILDKIDAVTVEDIRRIANSTFKDEHLNLAVISTAKDEKKIKEALRFI